MTGAIVSMLVGIVIPALVALVTREALPEPIKEGLLLLLSTATGILSAVVTSPPTSVGGWEHVALNILVTFLAAEASAYAQHKVTLTRKIHAVTDAGPGLGARSAPSPEVDSLAA